MPEKKSDPVIGVLCLQGGFFKHIEMLKKLGIEALDVRKPEDLAKCDGLIIPGGESTTIMKQMIFSSLKDHLSKFAQDKPVFGTCAGLILISNTIVHNTIKPYKLLNVTIERNAYGRQIDSFIAQIDVLPIISKKPVPGIFIRAPRILDCGEGVVILGKHEGEPVFVQQGHHLGASFHPELNKTDTSIHAYFIELVKNNLKKK